MKRGIPTSMITLVRLESDDYSVPRGTLGHVERRMGDVLSIQWAGRDGFSGPSSANISADAVEEVGTLAVTVPRDYTALLKSAENAVRGFAVILASGGLVQASFVQEGLETVARHIREELEE